MARTVPLKLTYASRSGLVKGPQYTIQEDPPWLQTSASQSTSALPAEPRPSSSYSRDDFDAAAGASAPMVTDSSSPTSMPAAMSPQTPTFPPSSDSLSSRKQEVVADAASHTRSSRMPIFKQVRSMLTSTRTANGSSNALKWDEYSGEPSENGKERLGVKPSTYKSPYEGILKSRKQSPPGSRDQQQLGSPRSISSRQFSPASPSQTHLESPRDLRDSNDRRLSPAGLGVSQARDASPVSALVEDDMHILEQQDSRVNISPPDSRSVSPAMTYEQLRQLQDTSTVQRPRTTEGSAASRVKRKPLVPTTTHVHDFEPSADVRVLPSSSHGESTRSEDPASRFSWTTAAHSEAPRKSTDTRYSRPPKTADGSDRAFNSHFSWSTVASTAPMAGAMREQTPPPSPPPVPVQYLEPPSYGTPPTQSILSRHRPFKRVEKPEWAPPPQPTQQHSFTPRSFTPKVYRIQDDYEVSTTPTADGKKRLPLPPLFTEKSLSHLEGLLSQEKSIAMQRRNIERAIIDLEKVEKASPLEVSFSAVREAKKKLEERRGVLDEIRKEEMEIGIRIARARRKEDFGDGEGTLWVRRVTG